MPWAPTIAVVAGAVFLLLRPPVAETPALWSRLDTEDVHSLSFPGQDPERLLFGHHGGLLGSSDGGRTWAPLPVKEDAMSMAPAADGSIVIAGHDVFTQSADEGATWSAIETDLPSLDIHGFARDPSDAARMWAYPVTGGLWESRDGGAHFMKVREDNLLYPVAVTAAGSTRLLGVDVAGFVASDDGGRSWNSLGAPAFGPITALTATPDGGVLYAGSADGLFRSDDGGRTWGETGYKSSVFAVAAAADGRTVAVVSRATEFFRSADGGVTWRGP